MVEINDQQLDALKYIVGLYTYFCNQGDYSFFCNSKCPIFKECWEEEFDDEEGLEVELKKIELSILL